MKLLRQKDGDERQMKNHTVEQKNQMLTKMFCVTEGVYSFPTRVWSVF